MKLEKFKENNRKKTGIIVFTVCCILLIAGVFFYNSFALFNEKKNFNVINGNVEDPGDLYFAYYVDDVITYNVPSKDSGYTLSGKSSCNNGVVISWDDEAWTAILNYQNYQSGVNSRVKCNLYFEKKVSPKDYILANAQEGQIIEDDETEDHNLRYIGANPNNYIDIGDRDAAGNIIPWRIIGVMNNVGDGNGNNETRLKIIRSEGIGYYSWDTSASNINGGTGINEWSQADIMKLLNPGYESESIGGSLYWNRGTGNCYSSSENYTEACDFTSSGLSNDAKSHIGEALWHTGSNGSEESFNNILTSKFYELEKSNNTGKICTSGGWCNDNVERTTTWKGLIGLMSPADYGYATSGGNNTNRETCLNTKLFSWADSGVEECKNNDWLYNFRATEWTLMPSAYSTDANAVFSVQDDLGAVYGVNNAHSSFLARPVVYLSSGAQIIDGDGTLDNMFVVALR